MNHNQKYFISLSSIPSRMKDPRFFQHMQYLLKQETTFEKLFLCIPQTYKRFPEESIPYHVLDDLEKLFGSRFRIIWMDVDYGPACKYLGPLIYCFTEIQNHVLIIIDDDRFFHSSMVTIYKNLFLQYQDIAVITGDQEFYFNIEKYQKCTEQHFVVKKSIRKYVAGFMSFALHLERHDFQLLIEYTKNILFHIAPSFFHDEGILMNYLLFKTIPCLEVEFPFINFIEKEMQDSLVSGKYVDRKSIEKQIMNFTNRTNILDSQFHTFYLPLRFRRFFR